MLKLLTLWRLRHEVKLYFCSNYTRNWKFFELSSSVSMPGYTSGHTPALQIPSDYLPEGITYPSHLTSTWHPLSRPPGVTRPPGTYPLDKLVSIIQTSSMPGKDTVSLDVLLALMVSVGSLTRHNEMLRKLIHATDSYKEAKLLIYHYKYNYQVHWIHALLW